MKRDPFHSLALPVLLFALSVMVSCGEDADNNPVMGAEMQETVPIEVLNDTVVFEVSEDGWIEGKVGYEFRNVTEKTVNLPNCNGVFDQRLDRLEDREWEKVWSSLRPLCASPPIVVKRGETIEHELEVLANAGESGRTRFNVPVDRIEGIYRVVIRDVFWASGNRVPLKDRRSKPFEIKADR